MSQNAAPDSTLQTCKGCSPDSYTPRKMESLDERCHRDAWNSESAPQFVEHLLKTHHPHLRERMRRVEKSIVLVAARYGLSQGHTWDLAKILVELEDRLDGALAGEGQWLLSLLRRRPADTEQDPARQHRLEEFLVGRARDHEAIAAMFQQIRTLPSHDATAAESSPEYTAMLGEIAAFERDYQEHWLEQEKHLGALFAG